MGEWSPHLHPRDFRGRFKGGSLTYEVKPYPGEREPVHAWEFSEAGRVVSGLYADLDSGQILHVETEHDQRGQGLASGLYREAADKVEVFHSPQEHRTEAGESFARSVGGPTIDPDRAHQPAWDDEASSRRRDVGGAGGRRFPPTAPRNINALPPRGRAAVRTSLLGIARVHRPAGDPPTLARLPDDFDELGRWERPRAPSQPNVLFLSTPGSSGPDFPDDLEHTVTHEMGHHLDFMGLGDAVDYATARRGGELGGAMEEFFRAADASEAIRQIRASEDPLIVPDLLDHQRYLLRDREVWARAYAQFIAMRSGEETLVRQLGTLRQDQQNSSMPEQWTDDDFAPLDAAMARVLGVRGLM